MRLLVISDSHGDVYEMNRALSEQRQAEIVFFLGDGERDVESVMNRWPEKKFFSVKGNCDFGSSLPVNFETRIMGKNIFITHGYAENVKYGLTTLYFKAAEKKADICLFGHTHNPMTEYNDGIYFMNPGSLHDGRYGVIDITESGGVMPILMRTKW